MVRVLEAGLARAVDSGDAARRQRETTPTRFTDNK
jgi:hypothetical protein